LINEEESSPYEIQEFRDNPGMHLEKIGRLHYARETWKLVIKLDYTTLTQRYEQITKYLHQTEVTCRITQLCDHIAAITGKEMKYLKNIITQIQTIYRPPTNRRRGLIDGIGSIAKALFGTMDANDEKLINEQIQLLQNKQLTLQHAVQNQLTVLNTTIAHLENLETIIDRNEKLLQKQLSRYLDREEMNEHFMLLIAVIADLIRDAENIIEYLTYIKKGAMHPKLMPTNDIIAQLKEATPQLPQGLYFPFKVHAEDWLAIERHTEITVYCDKTNIYTILRFPLIAQPTYDLINVIALPIHDYDNVFTATEINNNLIAIDKDKLTYLKLAQSDLDNCVKDNSQYICTHSMPIYRVNSDAPCEVQMYTQRQQYHRNCNKKHIISSEFWIRMNQPHTWLYSIAAEQHIVIECNGRHEHKEIIRNTGKLILKGKCRLTTPHMTIQSTEVIFQTETETYLPEVNMTLLRDQKPLTDNKTLDSVLQHRAELGELKIKLEKINSNIENSEQEFFTKKQFIYPMASSAIITIIIVIIIAYIIIQRKNKNKKIRRPIVTIEDNSDKLYRLPRPILKRSQSMRY